VKFVVPHGRLDRTIRRGLHTGSQAFISCGQTTLGCVKQLQIVGVEGFDEHLLELSCNGLKRNELSVASKAEGVAGGEASKELEQDKSFVLR
jgi:hypothetical protein